MTENGDDVEVKIGTVEEKAWTDILNRAKEELARGQRELIINQEIIYLAERMIEEEQANNND